MASLDKAGLAYLWSKLKAKLNGKADAGHTHSYNDLSNKPSSLPANGGNADTVDNYHIRKVTNASDTGQTGSITFIV